MPIFVYMNKRDEWYETGKVVQQASRTKSWQRCSDHIRAAQVVSIPYVSNRRGFSSRSQTRYSPKSPRSSRTRGYSHASTANTPRAPRPSRTPTAAPRRHRRCCCGVLLRLSTWQTFARADGRILRAARPTARSEVRARGQVIRDRIDLRADVAEYLLGRRRWLPYGVRERYV